RAPRGNSRTSVRSLHWRRQPTRASRRRSSRRGSRREFDEARLFWPGAPCKKAEQCTDHSQALRQPQTTRSSLRTLTPSRRQARGSWSLTASFDFGNSPKANSTRGAHPKQAEPARVPGHSPSERHARHEDERADAEAGERHERGTRTDAGEAPAHTEDGCTGEKSPVDRARLGQIERGREHRRFSPEDQPHRDRVNADRAEHHEHQARIPRTEEIEKAAHLRRIGHAGDREADPEDEARDKSEQPTHRTCSAKNTVMKPVVMKVIVATIERFRKRLMPQTP